MAQREAAASFEQSTRLRYTQMENMDKPTGGGLVNKVLPPVGMLAAIHIPINITISGTLSAQNAYGTSSALARITLNANNGVKYFDVSGIGYSWLLKEMLDDNADVLSFNAGKTAVSAASFRLDVIIPVAHNSRDATGLIMLQNRSTVVDLTINWAADTVLATGATVTGTARPVMVTYDVPSDRRSWPLEGLSIAHQILEEQPAIAAAGPFQHRLAVGGVYVGVYYLLKNAWTETRLVAQQSNVFEKETPEQHRLRFAQCTGRDINLAGTAITGFDKRIFYDFAGSDGLGQFGSVRDLVDSNALTDFFAEPNASAADTLYAVRRQFISLGRGR